MPIPAAARAACAALALALPAPAPAYITVPPLTLQKMCEVSPTIRVLKVKKHSKEKGVILFEVAETIRKQEGCLDPGRHALMDGATGAKPIRDWAGEGKLAVMFSIDGTPKGGATPMGVAYVFVDGYCYFADYSPSAKHWVIIRGDPDLSACYHGPAGKLPGLVKAVLAGRKVDVPTKEPAAREDRFKRNNEIEAAIIKNRK